MTAPVFIALDFPDAASAQAFLAQFHDLPAQPAVKVGMELFYAAGPAFVRELRAQGFAVFLDL